MRAQYDEKTDAVIYGDATADFTRLDWLRLAAAALDQAEVIDLWRAVSARVDLLAACEKITLVDGVEETPYASAYGGPYGPTPPMAIARAGAAQTAARRKFLKEIGARELTAEEQEKLLAEHNG